MSQAKNVNTTSPSRRAVLAGIATMPAILAPALALTAPDPIFAVIGSVQDGRRGAIGGAVCLLGLWRA